MQRSIWRMCGLWLYPNLHMKWMTRGHEVTFFSLSFITNMSSKWYPEAFKLTCMPYILISLSLFVSSFWHKCSSLTSMFFFLSVKCLICLGTIRAAGSSQQKPLHCRIADETLQSILIRVFECNWMQVGWRVLLNFQVYLLPYNRMYQAERRLPRL